MSKEYTLKVEIQLNADSPLEASKKFAEWLRDDADGMVYDVIDEETKEKFTVDLSEEDENAVLENF